MLYMDSISYTEAKATGLKPLHVASAPAGGAESTDPELPGPSSHSIIMLYGNAYTYTHCDKVGALADQRNRLRPERTFRLACMQQAPPHGLIACNVHSAVTAEWPCRWQKVWCQRHAAALAGDRGFHHAGHRR